MRKINQGNQVTSDSFAARRDDLLGEQLSDKLDAFPLASSPTQWKIMHTYTPLPVPSISPLQNLY